MAASMKSSSRMRGEFLLVLEPLQGIFLVLLLLLQGAVLPKLQGAVPSTSDQIPIVVRGMEGPDLGVVHLDGVDAGLLLEVPKLHDPVNAG